MTKRRDPELTLEEAAELLGISRAALYGRIRRSRKRGERVPFRRRRRDPRGRLVVRRSALLEWNARRERSKAKTTKAMKKTEAVQTPAQKRRSVAATSPATSQVPTATGPTAPSAAAVAPTKDVATEPPVTRGAPIVNALPESYMENRLDVLIQTPDSVVAYWDVAPETALRYAGSRWGLQVRTDTGEEWIEVTNGAKNWYIGMPGIGRRYEIAFGPIDSRDTFVPIARATWAEPEPAPRVEAPTERTAASVAEEPASPDVMWGRPVDGPNGLRVEVVPAFVPEVVTEVVLEASRMPEFGPSSPGLPSSGSFREEGS